MQNSSPVAVVIISVALMLMCGFLMTRITKHLRLPNVTAYIISGILLGPQVLHLVPEGFIAGTDFLPDIALAFIAFGVGEFFTLETLKKNGMRVVVLTLFESLVASLLVFVIMHEVLNLGLAFSIVLAALASATAPASTIMTIRQTHAKGEFVDTLLQVVALDDVVGLLAYSAAMAIAMFSVSSGASIHEVVLKPIVVNLFVLVLGGGFGVLLKFLLRKRSDDNRLIIALAVIFAFCGICAKADVSPLLGCMSMGMVYINVSRDDKLFKQLNYFSPPILLMFFVRSGLGFRIETLFSGGSAEGGISLGLIGIIYFLVRIIGKYAGAYLGSRASGQSIGIRRYLGLALIPQAGVSIGLAALCARTLGKGIGTDLETIILASSVLYELLGPACAKASLYLSGAYSDKLEEMTQVEQAEEKTPVELLILRLEQIRSTLPSREEAGEDEKAFNQAAEEHYMQLYGTLRPGPIRR